MKKTILLINLVLLLLCSCQNKYKPRNITSIKIETFKRDSTSIRAIKAISTDTLYYAGSKGDISSTFDGGKTWNTQFIKYNDTIIPTFRSIAYNGKDIFALSIVNPALLYKVSKNEIELVYQEIHPKVFYDSMKFFANGQYGIAVGDPTDNCPSIIRTNNYGVSWEKISCDNLPKFKDGEAFFAASNTNITIVKNTVWIVSGGKKSRILKSEDKGLTWEVFETPFVQGSSSEGMYSIDFVDKNNGIVIGGDYMNPSKNYNNKAITTDGGKTWKIIANGENPGYKSCVQFVPNTNGKEIFAVGKTGICYSNNGGISWKKISNESYFTINFVDNKNAWLGGHEKIGKITLP